MAHKDQNVCVFNKYGYCKFRLTCRKQHILEICPNQNCEILRCSLRHPKICRYFRDFGMCKFGEWCLFRHELKVNKEMEDMKRALELKVETCENDLRTLQTCLGQKDLLISKLEERLQYFEKTLKLHSDKINDLDEKLKPCEAVNDLDNKVKNLEEKQTNLIEESNGKYKCNQCDFTTYHKKGLNIHRKKMHKAYSCNDCDDIFDTKRAFKVHSYTHSFTNIKDKHKCNNCDFESESLNTVEVHVGKCRESNFDCGLCGEDFEKLQDLETHLRTCEIYECQNSSFWMRCKNLSEMKKHIQENHSSSTELDHLKIDRKKEFNVSSTFYSLKDI